MVTAGRSGFRVVESAIDRPLELFEIARARFRYSAILESLGEYDPDTARYTIVGVVPRYLLHGATEACVLDDLESGVSRPADWLSVLDAWTGHAGFGRGTSPLTPGAIGYLGYENRFRFEAQARRHTPDHRAPDVWLVYYGLLLVQDRHTGKSHWVIEDGVDPALCDELTRAWRSGETPARREFRMLGDIVPDFSSEQYLQAIAKTIEYIRNGDIFQANMTMRFHGRCDGDLFQLYRRLREVTPNPFFAYLDGETPLISTSPECFVKVEGGAITTYPIKGTIRCNRDGTDQRHLLEGSAKNNAENTMITDLMRNDIGRVCRQGTVEVPTLCGIKKFNSLYHLESIVRGQLREDVSASEMLRATFPGGSITGAPKIRAEDIIEELELTTRGPYTGAIGFFGGNGWTNTSIAIRIVYQSDERFFFHAGGGIVVDSVPDDELDELMLKVEGIRAAATEFNILREQRAQLDSIDEKLLTLLALRFSTVMTVADVKKRFGIPLMQRGRVSEMLVSRKRYVAERQLPVTEAFLEDFYKVLVQHSMAIEQEKCK